MDTYRTHCGHCGTRYPEQQLQQGRNAPRKCVDGCGAPSWTNPTPIAVLLQPVHRVRHNKLEYGLLIGQRGVTPKLGEWGLPGGFVDHGDYSYELAALREAREEVELRAPANWTEAVGVPTLMQSMPGDPGQIIAFSHTLRSLPEQWLQTFVSCAECPAVTVAYAPTDLCFASHTLAMAAWFHTLGGAGCRPL